MASLPLTSPLSITTTTTDFSPFRNSSATKHRYVAKNKPLSCKATFDGSDQTSSNKFDRRNVLLGLGGLYGAAGLAYDPFAFSAPVLAPDLSQCGAADLPEGSLPTNCCPPNSPKIIDFKPPPVTRLRVRPAAHKADKEFIAKYNKALELMKALPDTDPRSFSQQADVHCAYCNGAYDQNGFPGVELQIHNSWLFFPFHRWYLYFYEKILGKLINDPTFAIPYWNWDNPPGMQMPVMFTNPNSVLYDKFRSSKNQPPKLVDLDYNIDDILTPTTVPDKQQISTNLNVMYRSMVSNATNTELFFGGDFRAGEQPENSPGSIENIPHGPIHLWSGDETQTNFENMGNFYSAGRDPLFYCHHANVDRMWNIWKTLPGKRRKDITDPDWLNTTFLFYDENAQLVRVNVKDSLESKKLGYIYQDVELPWLKTKPKPRGKLKSKLKSKSKKVADALFGGGIGSAMAADESSTKLTPLSSFPITLNKSVTVSVARPKTGRSTKEKEEQDEVLVISEINYNRNQPVKFDVYVNDEDQDSTSGPDKSEFAGSFVSVPHNTKSTDKTNTSLKLGITELLEDVGAEDDDNVLITLVPKSNELVTIGGIRIDLVT
ncbi:polyphenol oxidase, chloroplastic-like [Humulus lupulus]|uniref:polyphenol oxidase, chloroplastic-like n=1 Tax=Humulus lupulus TaxID=3486 RepID=UPI002B415A34|nr:polyphenol oxidase, chloroplastic-like [Humulus lupulus]